MSNDQTTDKQAETGVSRKGAASISRSQRREAKRAMRRAKKARRSQSARQGRVRTKKRLKSDSYPGPLVVRDSRSAQDALGYDAIFEDGVVRVEDGTYSRVIEFDDMNFQTAREDDQERAYAQWCASWNEFDQHQKIQLKVICQVIDRERFLSERLLGEVDGDDTGNRYRRELDAIISGKVAETRQNVTRRRLLVITVDQPTRERADTDLDHCVETVTRNLLGMGIGSVEVLGGNAILELVDSITNPADGPGMVSFDDLRCKDRRERSAMTLGYTTKDLVAPPDVSRPDAKHICWGDQYGQALYLDKWATTMRTDMLAALSELAINQVITVDVTPWDPANALELIEGVLTDLKSQKTEYVLDHSQTMYVSDEMLPSPLTDALDQVAATRDDLVNKDQRLFSTSVSLLTWAPDRQGCDESADLIAETLRRFGYRAAPLVRLQGQGLAAALPTGRCEIPYARNLTTAPLAALMPFSSVELAEAGGMYMGQNRISKNFVFYDRAHAVAPNGFILGALGRGKSVTAKSTIMWTRLSDPDADIVVVDPENEYGPLADALGGEVVKVGAGSSTHFNPLDLALEADVEDGPLQLKCDMIISAIEMMAKHLTELEKSLVDRCVTLVYARYLETRDPADQPILTDLYDELMRQEEPEARALATTIERYVKGQAAIFNHQTDVDLTNRLTVFNVRDNGDNMKPLLELFVLDWIWQRVVRNRSLKRRTWIFIDEIHLLFDTEYAISYFDSIWSRSRKYGAIPTGITQNAERLLEHDKTRKMLSNSDFLVLLGQSSTDAATIGSERRLSDEQVAYLERATPGSGIIFASGKVVEFTNVIPSDTEVYRLFNTKPGAEA